MIKNILFFYFVVSMSNLLNAQQTYTTSNKKAIKNFEQALKLYEGRNDKDAIVILDKVTIDEPTFFEARMLLGDIHFEANNFAQAAQQYRAITNMNPSFSSMVFYKLGICQMKLEKYEEAYKSIQYFVNTPNVNKELKSMAEFDLKSAAFAKDAIKNPVPFNPTNLGEAINSELSEYFPTMTVDEEMILYTRLLPEPNSPNKYNEDFFLSNKNENGQWTNSKNIGPSINTILNEGAPTLSTDGQTLIFTVCELFGEYGGNRKGFGSCDLFYSMLSSKGWSPAQNMNKPINSMHWESQPCFSADGKTLYFIRGVKNSKGKRDQDIYKSILQPDGFWSNPEKLSSVINTPGREESVFIHPDGKTLYFSSDGHPGFGGLDIFKSTLQEDGEWTRPINLGYPINTAQDENSLFVSANGKLALFASDRAGGFGGLDLYSFELPEQMKPIMVTYLKGKVYDEVTKKPLESVFELIDLSTGKTVVTSFSNPNSGEYLVSLPSGKEYALNASKTGYLFFSETFSLVNKESVEPFKKDVPLSPIAVNSKVVLKNIFFETGKYDLKNQSIAEINKLFEFLSNNKTLKIEIGGHTDNVGSSNSNMVLSQNRAKAVFDYLINKGIESERLTYKGYGDTTPIADNSNELGRAENRRTEFKIIGS